MEEQTSKAVIRRKYLERRNELSLSELTEKSDAIIERLNHLVCVQEAANLLLYSNYRSEVMTQGYIKALLSGSKKQIYLPRVTLNDIDFYRIEAFDELSLGYQGILEPLHKDVIYLFTKQEAAEPCVCVVPGAVFDTDCARMGYGKGFYDRFLSKYPDMIKVGLAFDAQISKRPLPLEGHDIKMDYVITETKMYTT